MKLVEKCKLSNFDESTVKAVFKKNRKTAVIIRPMVKDNGETEFFIGSAEFYRPRGKERRILWTLNYNCYHHILFEELDKLDYMYLCENRNEAKNLYSEWCKLPSTIDVRKKMIKNKISEYEKNISELNKKLESISY
jgi:hypothetical protein